MRPFHQRTHGQHEVFTIKVLNLSKCVSKLLLAKYYYTLSSKVLNLSQSSVLRVGPPGLAWRSGAEEIRLVVVDWNWIPSNSTLPTALLSLTHEPGPSHPIQSISILARSIHAHNPRSRCRSPQATGSRIATAAAARFFSSPP